MLNINIICLGRLKEDYLRAACKEYEKRLGTMCKLTISELEPIALPQNPSDKQIENALSKEAEMIEGKMLKKARRGNAAGIRFSLSSQLRDGIGCDIGHQIHQQQYYSGENHRILGIHQGRPVLPDDPDLDLHQLQKQGQGA